MSTIEKPIKMRQKTMERAKYAIDLYIEGHTLKNIARRMGLSVPRIWQYIHQNPNSHSLKKLHRGQRKDIMNQKRYKVCKHPGCEKGFYQRSAGQVYCSAKCRRKG